MAVLIMIRKNYQIKKEAELFAGKVEDTLEAIITGRAIEVKGATEHNLKNINVKFPLGQFVCVTGVSGSGKSTLVNEILYKTIARELNGSNEKPGKCKEIKGIDNIDKIINIDQSPIGRTPRSNPATYTGVFDFIRDIFAGTNEAKMRGYDKGRFSFNVAGGRCAVYRKNRGNVHSLFIQSCRGA